MEHTLCVCRKAFTINDNYASEVLNSRIIISEEENNTLKNNLQV